MKKQFLVLVLTLTAATLAGGSAAGSGVPGARESGPLALALAADGGRDPAGGVCVRGAATCAGADCFAAADGAPPSVPIAVLDLVYVDTSGEPRDQTQEHAARVRRFSDALRSDLASSGRFRIVTPQCGSAPCSASGEPSELVTGPVDQQPVVDGTPSQDAIDGDTRSCAQRNHDALNAECYI